MSIDRVKAYFRELGVEDKVQELEESSATVELAAQALGVEPGRIAKTLSFMVDGNPILIVAAGDVKIDNAKYKKFFGAKAKMLTPDEAVTLIGHAVGGVCPFALLELPHAGKTVTNFLRDSSRYTVTPSFTANGHTPPTA